MEGSDDTGETIWSELEHSGTTLAWSVGWAGTREDVWCEGPHSCPKMTRVCVCVCVFTSNMSTDQAHSMAHAHCSACTLTGLTQTHCLSFLSALPPSSLHILS